MDDHNWSEDTHRIFEFDPATNVTVECIGILAGGAD